MEVRRVPCTDQPSARRERTRWPPTKPVMPVIKARTTLETTHGAGRRVCGDNGHMNPHDGHGADPAVTALMKEIEERVSRKRAAGLYSVDALQGRNARTEEPFLADELVEVAKIAEIPVNAGLATSTKPGVGKAVGKVKEGLVRATSQPLRDVADRASTFNLALLSYVTQLSQEVVALRAEVEALRSAKDPGSGASG